MRSHPPGTAKGLPAHGKSEGEPTTGREPAAMEPGALTPSGVAHANAAGAVALACALDSPTWVLLRLEALAWPRFQSIECELLASLLTLPTAPATYNMSSGGSQTLPHAHCMPPYRWRSKCCGRTPMTEDMSTRPRPRLRAARLTLGRWCALQAVRRMAVAPEPTGASAEGSSPAPLLCDVLSYFG